MNEGHLTIQLQAILGVEGCVRFCQALGGTRVYVSHRFSDDHAAVEAVGRDLADKLSRAWAPATIRVPLARRERALFYRQQGLSDAKIALLLGITENGVGKLFKREADLPDRPGSAKSGAQLNLF
ncbi:hypothetical protein GGQ88_000139 [Novosphingobium hassiacum]|uniref:Uncharacterized protein n=1 Tax=Novosphingobium hassiacum TaxID=173676 RepID=A0A7W5ZUY6_9SPHN|nr:hypothetical protein [Novosphingobium hassiacum]MBB3858899.1 hypothetical protein [Novosphingobium hassiacum]